MRRHQGPNRSRLKTKRLFVTLPNWSFIKTGKRFELLFFFLGGGGWVVEGGGGVGGGGCQVGGEGRGVAISNWSL